MINNWMCLCAAVFLFSSPTSWAALATGPLQVSKENPRYFADANGKAVYLTGSHNWYNFQESGNVGEAIAHRMDYERYLEFLRTNHHNFMRLWTYEGWEGDARPAYYQPLPFRRTGPGKALDGQAKFDLHQFDPDYFQRLRSRVVSARDQGIYVAVMLFNGWSIQNKKGNPWPGHPFNRANNVDGIDGDLNGNGEGEELHTLAIPAVTVIQEAYVTKVIDILNDLDNVLYEIANESTGSKEWQYHFVRYIKEKEALKPKQHPVGMTVGWPAPGVNNAALFAGPADWISPNGDGGYQTDPPAADGAKVILSDTDHLWGEGGDQKWVWKSFCRGLNPIYMDRIARLTGDPAGDIVGADQARRAMGLTRELGEQMDFLAMKPDNARASTGYCLAQADKQYLVYIPDGGEVQLNLDRLPNRLAIQWIHPVTGARFPDGTTGGGAKQTFRPPFAGDAVLLIR